uniref:G-protein coupled receptors family 1 profile domain-containing protein n=1 Tax=Chaetoceros debilis TaxID=122233 RepID=A0A7S3Q2A2_9STRA
MKGIFMWYVIFQFINCNNRPMMMNNTIVATARILILLLSVGLQVVNSEDAAVGDGSCSWMEGNSTDAFYHNRRCKAALADERNHIHIFYMTPAASITAVISGSLSAVSSIAILCLIRRSSIGLSSIYHRIIFGLSVAELFASTAAAFGTVPLPKDVIYDFDPGWVHGNQTTCTIQGFFQYAFFPINAFFNFLLAAYYVLAINYKNRDAELKKNKMFIIFIPVTGILLLLIGPVLALLAGSFNPTPFDAWCGINPYPYYCQKKDDDVNNCLTGGNAISSVLVIWYTVEIIVLYILNNLTVIALVYVVIGVYRQERYIKEMYKLMYGNSRLANDNERRLASTKKRQSYTKALSVQCAAYILTRYIGWASSGGLSRKSEYWGLQFYHVSCRPLQGIFNLLIFVGHKAYDNKVMNQSLTVKQAIVDVFRGKDEEKNLISNMSLVFDDHSFYFDGDEEEVPMYDIDDGENKSEDKVTNEKNDNLNDGVADTGLSFADGENKSEDKVTNEKNDNLNDGVDETGLSFADDVGERKMPISSTTSGAGNSGNSRLSNDKSRRSKISNYSELFGSWISRDTGSRLGSLPSVDSGAVSDAGILR